MTRHRKENGGSLGRDIGRIALGAFLAYAGYTHLTVRRSDFQAQVPDWVPGTKDAVVLASGVAEIALGTALAVSRKHRVPLGWTTAAFFTAVFPGNVSQYVTRTSAFGLDTDAKRLARLPFQPALIGWALWSTGAWRDRR